MYFVYIIHSQVTNRFYIGSSKNVHRRVIQHNSGSTRSTKSGIPWKIVTTEEFQQKSDALRRERQIKSYKSGRAFKALIQSSAHGGVA